VGIAPAVLVQDVGKRFIVQHSRPTGLKQRLLRTVAGEPMDHEEFWALRDVSLEVAPGEMVGLVGANGSGKSTLLQVIAGIYVPDAGSVTVNGRLRSLLELGSGFSPELTGRENVYLNASLLGFAQAEVRQRFDRIVAFAELERFIDMPLKTYSSGMQVRLGFAVAIHLDPEILLLDEVLAVGDDHFQRKCLHRIREIRDTGTSILFISHDLVTVEQLCTRVGLMADGQLVRTGPAASVISQYRASLAEGRHESSPTASRWGTGDATIERVELRLPSEHRKACRTGDPLAIRIEYTAHRRLPQPVFGIAIRADNGTLVSGPNTKMCGVEIDAIEGPGVLEYRIPKIGLLPGGFVVSAAIYDRELLVAYDHWESCADFIVLEDGIGERFGVVSLEGSWLAVGTAEATTS
jgi:ABC-type polysaccharide/polyol phosphate transport system ATPase subunit